MPEYLAPGVFVEEVDTGAKPIEGVSTSTSAMVGVTERGPVDVPVLVTSYGEFSRIFGGRLRSAGYGDHRFLPHAVEGFFTNGGRRVYVVRVLDPAASKAAAPLFDRGDAAPVTTRLLRAAGEGTGSAAAPPPLVALATTGLGAGDWLRIGGGSTAEHRQLAGSPVAESVMVPLDLPLTRSHPGTEQAHDRTRTVGVGFTLHEPADAGDAVVRLRGPSADIDALVASPADLVNGDVVLEVGAPGEAEYRMVREVTEITVSGADKTARVSLDAPLALDHGDTDPVHRITFGPVADAQLTEAVAGGALAFVDNRGADFADPTHLVVVGDGPLREVRGVGALTALTVTPGAADDVEAGALAEVVAPAPPRTLANVAGDELTLQPREAEDLEAGQRVVVDPAGTPQTVTIVSVAADVITVSGLGAAPANGDEVVPAEKRTTSAALGGTRVLALDDRMGVAVGSLLRVGPTAISQVVTVTAVPAQTALAPDGGNVVVTPALGAEVADATSVSLVRAVSRAAGRPATALALGAPFGETELVLGGGGTFLAGEMLRLTTAGSDESYHSLTGAAPATGEAVTLQTALARSHPAGSTVVSRSPLVDVEALDAGAWGNRLRVSVTDDLPGLVSSTTLSTIVNPATIRLASRAGVQPGTVLELSDAGGVLGEPVKVRAVDRATGNVLLAGVGLAAAQQVVGLSVRSLEFTIEVSLLRQPDPAAPSRDSQVIDREVFRHLSLDPRHSNYVEKVIGPVAGPLRKWDRRTEGSSLYIRVADRASGAAAEAVRRGPEALVDRLADGRLVPARQRLETVLGDDSIGSLGDLHYIGADHVDPELRTGLQSVRNVEEVSLLAVPGRVSATLQQAVIDHCELMRYRFAVLDTTPEPGDTVTDAQTQRQQFDTKYAALYYPWLAIPDPFPANLADVHDHGIPPSGHMLGLYARVDIERGVHKAPANEVVRGITGLRRKVNTEQQEILNPYPVNVNVIRDFRENNRGIRAYGARVITSDPDWKYVNVRRLLIFIEASVERGLQWVVFEPNSEPLWARVRRVVANFLTVIWRNGALEGTKPEEAFFVRCDRTTMTQTDIDNGRLIVQVGVAPVKPAEFVIVRIGLWTARSDS